MAQNLLASNSAVRWLHLILLVGLCQAAQSRQVTGWDTLQGRTRPDKDCTRAADNHEAGLRQEKAVKMLMKGCQHITFSNKAPATPATHRKLAASISGDSPSNSAGMNSSTSVMTFIWIPAAICFCGFGLFRCFFPAQDKQRDSVAVKGPSSYERRKDGSSGRVAPTSTPFGKAEGSFEIIPSPAGGTFSGSDILKSPWDTNNTSGATIDGAHLSQDAEPGMEHPTSSSSQSVELSRGNTWKTSMTLTPRSLDERLQSTSTNDVEFPANLGRSGVRVRGRKSEKSFNSDEEEQKANALEREGKKLSSSHEPGGLGKRIALKDVRLKANKDGKIIKLGEGGFGRVYYGTLHKEECAVKVVLGHKRHDQARFLKEIKILGRLSSRYVTRYMGYSVCPEGLVLLMEYLPGGTLRSALVKEPSQYHWYKRGKEAMVAVALALNHLHGNGVAHLDIKSPNILLDAHGEAKVADVGLSKLLTAEMSIVSLAGSPPWTSPEQMRGEAGTPADIWSFGTVLWEVCTLEAPPKNRRLREIEVPEEAPQDVVNLFYRCHQADWRARPTACQLHTQLLACTWPQPASDPSVDQSVG